MIILIDGAYREENDSYARRLIEQGQALPAPEPPAEPEAPAEAEAPAEPVEEPEAEEAAPRKSRKK